MRNKAKAIITREGMVLEIVREFIREVRSIRATVTQEDAL